MSFAQRRASDFIEVRSEDAGTVLLSRAYIVSVAMPVGHDLLRITMADGSEHAVTGDRCVERVMCQLGYARQQATPDR